MLSDSAEFTREVVMLKVVELLPAWTVTVDGTCKSGEVDPSETVTPPVGAFPFRYSVPVLLAPPVTDDGEADI